MLILLIEEFEFSKNKSTFLASGFFIVASMSTALKDPEESDDSSSSSLLNLYLNIYFLIPISKLIFLTKFEVCVVSLLSLNLESKKLMHIFPSLLLRYKCGVIGL